MNNNSCDIHNKIFYPAQNYCNDKINEKWANFKDGYKLLNKINNGAFSEVYRAVHLSDNKIVAIKIIDLEKVEISIEDILTEITTMKKCKHPNILQCYCCFSDESSVWIVTPFMNMGSCYSIIKKLKQLKNVMVYQKYLLCLY